MSDISAITDLLYISSHLDDTSLHVLRTYNFSLIISMIGPTLPDDALSESQCRLLFLKTYDHVLFPIPLDKLVQGVTNALPVLERQQKVLVYCQQGRRRSVTMAAAILIARGFTAAEASRLIKEKREVATPEMFYVRWRIRRFERYWKAYGHRHV